jgi:hypothetical protein
VVTGHPALKLVLLTVAAMPGWPTAEDIAAASELDDQWTRDALDELGRRGHITVYHTGRLARYGLVDEGGWGYAGERDGDERPSGEVKPPGPDISGYAFGHHARRQVRR